MSELRIATLILGHAILTTLANVGFKLSSGSSNWRDFWGWQIMGNMAGFAGVLKRAFPPLTTTTSACPPLAGCKRVSWLCAVPLPSTCYSCVS